MENIKHTIYLLAFVILFSIITKPLILTDVSSRDHSSELTYKVQHGDNLWVIGNKLNVQNVSEFVFEVKKANNLEESILFVDQIIKIP